MPESARRWPRPRVAIQLLHGQERVLYRDQAYWKDDQRVHWQAERGRYRVNRRGTKRGTRGELTPHQKALKRNRSRTHVFGEFPFHVIKRLWGFTKVRYRGLARNAAQAFTLFGLANLYPMHHGLLPAGFTRGASPEPHGAPSGNAGPDAGPRGAAPGPGTRAFRTIPHTTSRSPVPFTRCTGLCRASLRGCDKIF